MWINSLWQIFLSASSSTSLSHPGLKKPIILSTNWIPVLEQLCWSPFTLSPSLPLSLFHSPSLCSSHLGDSSMHAAANLSRCLSGCCVSLLCAPLFFQRITPRTALHSFPHISISPPSFILYLHSSHTICSYLCRALLLSALLFVKIFFTPKPSCARRRGFGCSLRSRFRWNWTLWI